MSNTTPSPSPNESFSQEELDELLSLDKSSDFQPLQFSDAVDLILTFDPILNSGQRKLHKWQVEDLMLLSDDCYTPAVPLEYQLCAANGSGKDAYIIAPFSIFRAACKVRNRIVATSASFTQLQMQTEAYMRNLAKLINMRTVEMEIYEKEPFIIKKQHIVNRYTGSEIITFVTDDYGRAEGYHPFPDSMQSKVWILLNEAKTIPDTIFGALSRCTYSGWLEISSPGGTRGQFYKDCNNSLDITKGYVKGKRTFRRVTSYDCSHIPRSKIEKDRVELGEHHPLFRSKHLALFTSVEENAVIPSDLVDASYTYEIEIIELPITVGIDLAAGGDENSFYAFKGNKKLYEYHWREVDTTKTAKRILELLSAVEKKAGEKILEENIYADDGNVGHSIIDMIKNSGIHIKRVCNQSAAFNTDDYGNRGAEMYFNVRRLFEEHLIPLDKEKDEKLISQLKSRYYKQSDARGKITLESKSESRSKGHGSPDRADAFVLAMARNTPRKFRDAGKPIAKSVSKSKAMSMQELVNKMQEEKFAHLLGNNISKSNADVKKVRINPSNILRRTYGRD
jgi:hypothetical protein